MLSYNQSRFSNYRGRRRRLVLIQMAVIKTIKSCRNMDGGWGGYHTSEQHTTAVLGERPQILEQTETRRAEQREGTGATPDEN